MLFVTEESRATCRKAPANTCHASRWKPTEGKNSAFPNPSGVAHVKQVIPHLFWFDDGMFSIGYIHSDHGVPDTCIQQNFHESVSTVSGSIHS